MRRLDSITNSMDMNLSKLWEIAKDRGAWRAQSTGLQSIGHDSSTEQQQSKEWVAQEAENRRAEVQRFLGIKGILGGWMHRHLCAMLDTLGKVSDFLHYARKLDVILCRQPGATGGF